MAPDLDLLWRSYVRRFDLEHTFRFLKQSMGWSTPRIRHPDQADRWTWLVVAAVTQLRLARAYVADQRLPWERRYDTGRLTPVRVPPRRFGAFGARLHARQAAETLRQIARQAQRSPLWPSDTRRSKGLPESAKRATPRG
jgi:hypothetical protein